MRRLSPQKKNETAAAPHIAHILDIQSNAIVACKGHAQIHHQ